MVRSSIVESQKNWILKNLFVESLVCLSMSISYLSFSSYDFHSCDCTCVKCYSLGLLYTPIKYCKCKLPLESFVGLDFAVRSRRVECQCLRRYKKNSLFLFVNVDRLSQLSIRVRDSEFVVTMSA